MSRNQSVGIIPVNGHDKDVVKQLLCNISDLCYCELITGNIKGSNWVRLTAGAKMFYTLPLSLNETMSLKKPTLVRIATSVAARRSIELLVIDNLEEIDCHKDSTAILRNLKNLARQLNIPIVAVSHLGGRQNGFPEADLV